MTVADLSGTHDRWHAHYDRADANPGADAYTAHHQITAALTKAGEDHGCSMPVLVEMYRSRVTVKAAMATTDLPLSVIAALREAATQGYSMVEVIGMLGVNGYELRVAPVGEEDAAPLAEAAGVGDAPEPEPEDTDMGKARSFDAENRMIARNKRRKAAMDPHDFVPARWATRDGRKRCVLCGTAAPDTGKCAGLAAARIAKAATYEPPAGVRDAAQRALEWIADGKAGDGFTAVGRKRASDLAAGRPVSADTITRMNAYFARHEVDRDAEGFKAGEDGYPTPGRVAWDAWGGDPGRSWAAGIVADLNKSDPGVGSVHVDTIMGGGRAGRLPEGALISDPPKRLPADNTGATMAAAEDGDPEMMDNEDALTPRQSAMYHAYEMIADLSGVWDLSDGPDGAHYIPAADNVFAARGIACENCCFYMGDGMCEIVEGEVEPGGACKLWIIPEPLMSAEPVTEAIGPHGFKKGEDGDGCAVCGQAQDNWRHSVNKAAVIQKEDARRFTLGPMYVPDFVDAHGEWTDADSLQQAVWDYVRSGDRRIRLQHNRDVVAGEWVECMAWPYPVTVPMVDTTTGKEAKVTYPANTVFLGTVWEPWAWELVKAGKLRGYSIGGRAERILADLPTEEDTAS